MKNAKNLPIAMAAVAFLFCVAAAPSGPDPAATANEDALNDVAFRGAGAVLAQSPNDFGACYTWNRLTPWIEMCNEVTRDYCEMANTITIGSRFVENGRCPTNS